MREELNWVCVFNIDPSRFEEFKALVRPIVEATKLEKGCLSYEYNISDDRSAVHIAERFRSSRAAVDHVQNTFGPFAARFMELASLVSFTVYGEPDEEGRKVLDGFNAVYLSNFDGFRK
jgi:quinol monooxygenase YgiN